MNRILKIAAFTTFAVLACATAPQDAHAQRTGTGAYCAIFSDDGGMDCSYPTFQACQASVSGVGGSCNVNPRGAGNAAPPNFMQRMMRGNGPAFAPVDVGPPPDSGIAASPAPARRPTGMDGRYCSTLYDGSMNCSFSTLQSCLTATRGVGGSCNVNPRTSWR